MPKLNLTGLVVSHGKMAKTVKVRVQSTTYDKRIHKEVLKRKDYLVHDEGNLCKEGDVVRIEAIPRISPRKTFAIAEIMDDKGQKFAMYEEMAKKNALKEEKSKLAEFASHKDLLQKTVTQIADLRRLNEIAAMGEASESEADRDALLAEINRIKEKYGIQSWPSTEPVIALEIQKDALELSEKEKRIESFPGFYKDLSEEKEREILEQMGRTAEMAKSTKKNIVRKWYMDLANTP